MNDMIILNAILGTLDKYIGTLKSAEARGWNFSKDINFLEKESNDLWHLVVAGVRTPERVEGRAARLAMIGRDLVGLVELFPEK